MFLIFLKHAVIKLTFHEQLLPPKTFCQDQLIASSLLKSISIAKIPEVASQIVKPSLSIWYPFCIRDSNASSCSVPCENHIILKIYFTSDQEVCRNQIHNYLHFRFLIVLTHQLPNLFQNFPRLKHLPLCNLTWTT